MPEGEPGDSWLAMTSKLWNVCLQSRCILAEKHMENRGAQETHGQIGEEGQGVITSPPHTGQESNFSGSVHTLSLFWACSFPFVPSAPEWG